jgi:hypothetical protein
MGFYALEPCGERLADLRHGIATSVLANINRDSKQRPIPFAPADFIWWGSDTAGDSQAASEELVLLDDPAAQSALIKAAMFGKTH